MIDPHADAAEIAACIRRFAYARSSRGVWQVQRALEQQLARTGSAAVAAQAAESARCVGEWLRQVALPPAADAGSR